ncbi:uncharacterized protein LOC107269765 [Cephus cinctus]|uniref:Uncharacterized protein LOC107269765 n=2 Tax=Cephus cinctus TaxID=211228 RepID=A0AAJ7RLC6_CEPCN|nr:uncharacterized protein LOC107269765 [Cephus cinctus]
MAFVEYEITFKILGILIGLIITFYVYLKYYVYTYWTRLGIAQIEPSVPFGTLHDAVMGKTCIGELFGNAYAKLKQNRVFGMYMIYKPNLVITDPDLIRIVLAKEFSHFHDRGLFCNEKVDPLSANLVMLAGSRWQNLRKKLTPTFTSKKMREIFLILSKIGTELGAYLNDNAKDGGLIEIHDLMARYSTDVIASTAFGIDSNSIRDPNNEFRFWGRKAFAPQPFKNAMILFAPGIMDWLSIPDTPPAVSEYYINLFKRTLEYRRENNLGRKDFFNLLMQLMEHGYIQNDDTKSSPDSGNVREAKMTLLEGAAQAYIFFLAGFETSSSTATHCLYELVCNPDIQDKLREEIQTVLRKHGGLTYDGINEMKYLDKVVSETLRKYPSVPVLNRVCTKDFSLPDINLRVKKDIHIVISVLGLHHDPDYYPEPEKFDPERFSKENVSARHPCVYLPFGEGPRVCIGMRFGLLQTKVALVSVLSKFRCLAAPTTPKKLKFDIGNILLLPEKGVEIIVESLDSPLNVDESNGWIKENGCLVKKFYLYYLSLIFFNNRSIMSWIWSILFDTKFLLLGTLIISIYLYMKKVVYNYFEARGIPYEKPIVPFGSAHILFVRRTTFGELFANSYKKFNKYPYHGIFMLNVPNLVINDPEIIRLVLNKDFAKFHDRGLYFNEKADPLSGHLFVLGGEKWKRLRAKLSPTFTSGKIKQMFPVVSECSQLLAEHINESMKTDSDFEIKDLLGRYSTDVIASIAFGLDSRCLKDPNSDFRKYGKKIFTGQTIRTFLFIFTPRLVDRLGIRLSQSDVNEFFIKTFTEMVQYRKDNNIERSDMLNLLIQLMDKGYVESDNVKTDKSNGEVDTRKLGLLEAAAQAFVFFIAGFETSSSTVTYCLYELALNPEIQEKVRQEIETTIEKYGGLTYESLTDMTYLSQVLDETLRKYPTVPVLNRQCNEDFMVPTTRQIIPKGLNIVIPVQGLHQNPELYPDPEKFDPDRFSKENAKKIHPFAYLPFGEGPRVCIGKRFGLIQSKMAIISLLSRFRLSPCAKTTIPVVHCRRNLVMTPQDGVYLRFDPR